VRSHVFTDGDVIRIGDRVTGNFVSLVYQDMGKRAQAPVPCAGAPRAARPLAGPHRPEGCDLTLPSLQVSRIHAEIRRAGTGHEVIDLDSTNGTFIAGARVQTQRLKVGDVVQIGPFKLTYTGKSLDQLEQVGAMRIEARGSRA
jgi:pSer/pThr/pTyr-binding forkhead associated (FHA) protein